MIVFERRDDYGIWKKDYGFKKEEWPSQEELAEKVGVARQTISKWELGETSPDLKQSKELSKIFNVSLDELTDNDFKDVLIEKTSNTEKLAGLKLVDGIVIPHSNRKEDFINKLKNNTKEKIYLLYDGDGIII